MVSLFSLLRPQQWLKNLFVFLPLFFSGKLYRTDLLLDATYSFIAFSFMASAIYCINDIIDIEDDKKHKTKKYRPIASGKISITKAYIIAIILIVIAFATIVFLATHNLKEQIFVLICYLVINIFYCFWLKKIAILDVMIIATGFVLRLFIGGFAVNIELTNWIVIMTYLLALFMAFAKRRDDLIIYNDSGIVVRDNIKKYNLQFINQILCLLASITIVCYIMYTMSPEVINRFKSKHLYLSTIFVLAGIIRYLQLSLVDQKSGSPTKILIKDRFIQGCILFWIIAFYMIIYI